MQRSDDTGETTPKPAPLADSPLLRSDPDAVARAMEAYRPYLLSVANREIESALSQKAGGSDLVQETFLEAQRDLSVFQGRSEGELRGWLRRILRNNLANFVRRYRGSLKRQAGREISLDREDNDSSGSVKDELTSSAPSPSGLAIQSEEYAHVKRALEALSERDRQIVLWRSQDHQSWDEIGQRLGSNAVAARKAWSRAVQRLRDRLDEFRPPASDTPSDSGPR